MLRASWYLLSAYLLLSPAAASAVDASKGTTPNALSPLLKERALPDAPDGYTPAEVSCPGTRPSVRDGADGLSSEEIEWTTTRKSNVEYAIRDLLSRASIPDFDADSYLSSSTSDSAADPYPVIGIAFSGGGYRAMLNGAGAMAAFDNRTENATADGQLGGLLQSATYMAGLSGGSWLVTSIYVNNFTTVESILQEGVLWQFEDSILGGPADISALSYYNQLHDAVTDKEDAGFNTTITDYWSRALSYQIIDPVDGGPSYTFSSISKDELFSQALTPLPLVVCIERPLDQLEVPDNATVLEFNPWEMGSYDSGMGAFVPLKYIGSNFSDGTVISSDEGGMCIAGYDNAGYVMGTSSSLFNTAFLTIQDEDDEPGFLESSISDMLESWGTDNGDIATWPNPFYEYNPAGTESNNNDSEILTLVDGGEDLQNIPLHPLLMEARAVDVIIAIDSSADTSNWPNGTAMVATYERSIEPNYKDNNGTRFPSVPGVNTFVNLGLNTKPTFFGCDASNLSDPTTPLVVYVPNAPYTYLSNVSTFQLSYEVDQRDSIVLNGYNAATMGNATVEDGDDWPSCLACAMLSRSFDRKKEENDTFEVPSACEDCFDKYCWDGTLSEDVPGESYAPDMVIESGAVSSRLGQGAGVVAAVAGLLAAGLL
ncbi:hypothetical protein MKZ38_002319 [Zalerion maritima]|uniref:Lysophospholipase n=1 Tax=Zalerion maritima TaxID=339359 RepID=A0AAD5WSJ6_9PEZI|nr:hypothetical protein MKZ38_002319 [Zalerion maritima]